MSSEACDYEPALTAIDLGQILTEATMSMRPSAVRLKKLLQWGYLYLRVCGMAKGSMSSQK